MSHDGDAGRPGLAPLCLGLTATAMAVALSVGGRVPTLVFGGLAALFPPTLLWLASRRASRAVRISVAGLGAWLLASLICVVLLAENRSLSPVLGLPPATWVMLIAIGVVPLPWIFLLYLRVFDGD